MKKRLGIAVIAAVVVGIVAALFIAGGSAGDSDVLRISGNVEISDVATSFKVSGRVLARIVSEGELVKAGQVLARLPRLKFKSKDITGGLPRIDELFDTYVKPRSQ